jgi:hypothetical protein
MSRPVNARWWVEILDPYGVEPDLPDERTVSGRTTFVRSAESDGWVYAIAGEQGPHAGRPHQARS